MRKSVSPFTSGFMIVGALCGASFASGQEILKFFCSYEGSPVVSFTACFILYMVLGYMTYSISEKKRTEIMEEIVSPVDSRIINILCVVVIFFCFFSILTALLAAGDALAVDRLGLPKGLGGAVVTCLVIITSIVGISGIRKVMPKIVPVMLIMVGIIAALILTTTEPVGGGDPAVFRSPLAPSRSLGVLLYFSYNFLAAIPVLCTLPKEKHDRGSNRWGFILGFGGICIFGSLIGLSILTDLSAAGSSELPMVYLAEKLSPVAALAYAFVLVTAIYCSSSNCLFALTKDVDRTRSVRRIMIIIGVGCASYIISLAGFSTLVTYVAPLQGYSCILILILIPISFIKMKVTAGKHEDLQND